MKGLLGHKRLLAMIVGIVTAITIVCGTVMIGSASSWLDNTESFGYDELIVTYNIETPEQLAMLAYMVNTGCISPGNPIPNFDGFSGYIFTIKEDLDLSAHNWVPIGTEAMPFKGVLTGDGELGKTITGLTIQDCYKDSGLVGFTSKGVVTKLTVGGSISFDASALGDYYYAGGIVGRAVNDSAIASVTNNVNITFQGGRGYVGGVVASAMGKVGNAINNGTITATSTVVSASIGGVVAIAGDERTILELSNDVNNGNIISNAQTAYVGGILASSNNTVDLKVLAESTEYPVKNTGNITVSANSCNVGGIFGIITNEVENFSYIMPKNVVNTGNITVNGVKEANVATFTAYAMDKFTYENVNYVNSGKIKIDSSEASTAVNAGTLIGHINGEFNLNSVFNSENTNIDVNVSGANTIVGGLVGRADRNVKFDVATENNVVINVKTGDSTTVTGGIIGYVQGTFDSVESKINGDITVDADKDAQTGGFVGISVGATNIKDIAFSGKIETTAKDESGEPNVTGGIVGRVIGEGTITDASFEGIINDNSLVKTYTAGIAAYVDAQGMQIKKSVVSKTAADETTTVINGRTYIGGVSAYLKGSIEECTVDTVNITSSEATGAYIGGAVGYADYTVSDADIKTVEITTNSEKSYVGGAIGYANGYTDHLNTDKVKITVNGKEGYTGGCVAWLQNDINDSTGKDIEINVTGEKSFVGGLFGYNNAAAYTTEITKPTITVVGESSYVAGGSAYANGLIDTLSVSEAVIDVTGENSYVGGNVAYVNAACDKLSIEESTIDTHSNYMIVGGLVAEVSANGRVSSKADEDNAGIVDTVAITSENSAGSVIAGNIAKTNVDAVAVKTSDVTITATEADFTIVGGVIGDNKVVALDEENLLLNERINISVDGVSSIIGGVIGDNNKNIDNIEATDITIDTKGAGSHHIGGFIGKNDIGIITKVKLTNLAITNETPNSIIGGISSITNNNVDNIILTSDTYSTITNSGTNNVIGGVIAKLDGVSNGGAKVFGTPVKRTRTENLENMIITTTDSATVNTVGGVVGINNKGIVQDFMGNEVIMKISGQDSVVAGIIADNTIKDTQADVIIGNSVKNLDITVNTGADNAVVGGIIAKNNARGTAVDSMDPTAAISSLQNTHITGNITIESDNNIAGGAVGINDTVISNFSITDFVTLNVHGNNNLAGGLVGKNNKNVWFAYSNTALSVQATDTVIGGLVGENNASVYASFIDKDITTTITGTHTFTRQSSSRQTLAHSYTGGLVGVNNATVEENYVNAKISGGGANHCVGGLVGMNKGTIKNSYTAGEVTSDGSTVYAGGLVGRLPDSTNNTVTNCYSVSIISSQNQGGKGGFVGRYDSTDSALLTRCYYLKDESLDLNHGIQDFGDYEYENLLTPYRLNSITDVQLRNEAYFKDLGDWDFVAVWKYGSENSSYLYPELIVISTTSKNTDNYNINWYTKDPTVPMFKIGTESELSGLAKLVNGNVSGYPAIDFKDKLIVVTNNIRIQSAQWEPIGLGNDDLEFAGTFDGQNYLISGLRIASHTYTGLFGSITADATVKNVKLEPFGITAGNNDTVGSLVALNKGTVTNAHVLFLADTSIKGGKIIGGVVGQNDGKVENATLKLEQGSTIEGSANGVIMGGVIGKSTTGDVKDLTTTIVDGALKATPAADNAIVGGVVGSQAGNAEAFITEIDAKGILAVDGKDGILGGSIGKFVSGEAKDLDVILKDGKISIGVQGTGTNGTVGGIIGVSPKESKFAEISIKAENSENFTDYNIVAFTGVVGGAVGSDTATLEDNDYDNDKVSVEGLKIQYTELAGNRAGYVGGAFGLLDNVISNEATAKNLVIDATVIDSLVGGVVGYAKDTVIVEATSDTNLITASIMDTASRDVVTVGGIAARIECTDADTNRYFNIGSLQSAYMGINNSDIIGDSKIIITPIAGDNSYARNLAVGGIAGDVNSTSIYQTNADIDIEASGLKLITLGGAIGRQQGSNVYFIANTINPKISVSGAEIYNVGGFAGELKLGNIAYNKVLGDESIITVTDALGVTPKTNVGGFAAVINGVNVNNCYTDIDLDIDCDNSYNIIYAGGFVGTSKNSTINKCYSNSDMEIYGEKDSYAGGFVGYVDTGSKITECYTTDCVINNEGYNARTGGFAGSSAYKTEMERCYSTDGDLIAGRKGEHPASSAYAGGFIGYNNGDIKECYAGADKVNAYALSSSADFKGIFAGYNYEAGTILDSYYGSTTSISGVEKNTNATASNVSVTKVDLADRKAITTWDFATNNATWTYIDTVNGERPVLTNVDNWSMYPDSELLYTLASGASEYTVDTANELALVERIYNSPAYQGLFNRTNTPFPEITKITLAADVDMAAKTWNPLGVDNFTTLFEGGNFTINGIYRYAPKFDRFGFVKVNGKDPAYGTVQNVTFTNADVTTGKDSGIVVADNTAFGIVKNVHVENSSIEGVDTGDNIGAIVGIDNGGSVTDSDATRVKMKGRDYIGSIVGNSKSTGLIENVDAKDIEIEGRNYIGGLYGEIAGPLNNVTAENITIIANEFAGGIAGYAEDTVTNVTMAGDISVSTDESYAGGAVGLADKAITDITATADITVNAKDNFAGGFVGSAGDIVKDINSSGIIAVTSDGDYIGGVVGYARGVVNNIEASNVITVSGGKEDVGGFVGFAEAKVSEIKATNNIFVTGKDEAVGGIIGYASTEVGNITVTGDVTVSGATKVGGTIGKASGKVDNIVMSGKTTVEATGSCVGGSIGQSMEDITNITLNEVVVSGGKAYIGGAIGDAWKIVSTITINKATVTATGSEENSLVGGIAGRSNGTMDNVTVKDTTVTGNSFVGGVAGVAQNLTNANIGTANVKGNVNVGGFAGEVADGLLSATATGDITVTGTRLVGGVAGAHVIGDATITGLKNVTVTATAADIKDVSAVGGVIGFKDIGKLNASNIGNIKVVGGAHTAGIIGSAPGKVVATNIASIDVTGTEKVGGIAGETKGVVELGTVTGNIKVAGTSEYVGGVAGLANDNITATSVQDIAVTGAKYVGGIAGNITDGNTATLGSANNIQITGGSYAGGIVGETTGAVGVGTVNHIEVTGSEYLGGIVGSTNNSIVAQNVNGDIKVTGTGNYVGGISGNTTGAISTTILNDIEVVGKDYVGGIAGVANNITVPVVGNITAKGNEKVGGIAGEANGTISNITTKDIAVEGVNDIAGITSNVNNVANIITGDITVKATGNNAAGIVINVNDVTNITTGDITATATGNRVAGITAKANNISGINFSEMTVVGKEKVGGIAIEAKDITNISGNNVKVTGISEVSGIAISADNVNTINLVNLEANADGKVSGIITAVKAGYKANDINVTNAKVTSKGSDAAIVSNENSGTIENITISSGSVTAKDMLAGAVTSNSGLIKNVVVKANVAGGEKYSGGIVAKNLAGGTITNVKFDGGVTGASDYSGGIAGHNLGNITEAYSMGKVETIDTVINAVVAGGVVGLNDVAGTVTKAYTMSDVSVKSMEARVGGIAGENLGTIENCYTAPGAPIFANGKNLAYAGGIVGHATKGTLKNNINMAFISATNDGVLLEDKNFAGGIAGKRSTVSDSKMINNIADARMSGTALVYTSYNNRKITTQEGEAIKANTEALVGTVLPQGLDAAVWTMQEGFAPKLNCFETTAESISDSLMSRATPVFVNTVVRVRESFTLPSQGTVNWSGNSSQVTIAEKVATLTVIDPVVMTIASGTSSRNIIVNTDGDKITETATAPVGLVTETFKTNTHTIALTTEEVGGKIYYTIDGTTPTENSLLYTEPVVITATTTIKAVTVVPFKNNSAIVTGIYTKLTATPKPTARPSTGGGGGGGGGSYVPPAPTLAPPTVVVNPVINILSSEVDKGTEVVITSATIGSTIYYTLDGSEPTVNSTVYTGPITMLTDATIKVIAVKEGLANSEVVTRQYKITEEAPQLTPVFVDLGNYPWAEAQINSLAAKGIIKGVSDTHFAPQNNITRADYMVLMVRMLGLNETFSGNFDDVQRDKYYYDAIGIAKKLGLTVGIGNNLYNPDAFIKREEMFTITYKILQMRNVQLSPATQSAISSFADYAKISDFAREAIAPLVSNGIVLGDTNNCVNPLGFATRAETAVLIYKVEQLINK